MCQPSVAAVVGWAIAVWCADATGSSLLQRRIHRTRAADSAEAHVAETSDLHTVYPAGCSAFSLHQAIALDWSWRNVDQPGKLTRIVTGCGTEEDKRRAKQSVLGEDLRFDVFFTKDWNKEIPIQFSEVRSDHYTAYNRPFALAAWFNSMQPTESYIMYLDPDMVFVQPLLYHVARDQVHATEGRPVAQHYQYITARAGLSDPGWSDFAVPELCGPGCRALADAQIPNERSYAVGSPIVMHRNDWGRLLPTWTNFTVFVRAHGHVVQATWIKKGDPPYIAEMIAYSLAAVTINLPHQVVDFTTDGSRGANPPAEGTRLIHMCYPLRAHEVGFRWNKYRSPFGYGSIGFGGGPYLMDCGTPLFAEPPERDAAQVERRDSYWMIQQVTRVYNQAFHEFKSHACRPEELDVRKLLRVDENGWFIPEGSWSGQQPHVPHSYLISPAAAGQRGAMQQW